MYVNVGNLPVKEINERMKAMAEHFKSPTDEYIMFIIPVRDQASKIECLNPAKVSNDEYKLIETKMEEFNKKLNDFLNTK
jgi:hypothetical protein